MFRSISSIGLRTRFVLIGLTVLVPLVAVMLQLAQYERESAMRSAEQRVKLFASLTAHQQYQFVQQAQIVLSRVASGWQVLTGGGSCDSILADTKARHAWITGIRVSSLDGTGICADRPEILTLDISDRGYFREVLAGKAFSVSDRLTSRSADRQPIIGMAVPIRYGEQMTGVLAAAVDLTELADLLPAELTSDPHVVVNVIDRNGVLLARHPHDPELIGRSTADEPVLMRSLQNPSGTALLPDLMGDMRLFAFHDIDVVDWVVAVGISRDSVVGPIETALRKRLLLIAAIVLGSCLVGIVGGELLVFWPLRALARTAQALERGDMAARPPLTGLSEVGALERSLYRMAEAIQKRESDLKLSQEVREQAMRDAEEANEAKGRVLASMSHEIRTPLGGIIGYSDLLLGQKLQPQQRRFAERIEVAAASAISVIDGILDIARIEAHEVEIEQRPFGLSSLVDNAISMVRANAERKGLALIVELDPELPPAVLGDETRLRQVVLNLLTNAVKFTASGSVTLRVHLAGSGGRIRFSVIDTGIGIDEAQHHRLFKRFSQVHDTTGRDYGGTGLGLAISKELTELMGGQLGFSSQPGRGSSFWIELALPQADASRIERRSAPAPTPKVGRVLVVDDYAMSREITGAMLTEAGHEVDVVIDGAQAVEAIRRTSYDLVLMDIEMRGMNGMVAIEQIRRLDAPARHVPVIAMTANVLPQQIRAFLAAGMDDHLGKPFSRNELIGKVNLMLSSARPAAGGAAIQSARVVDFDKKALTQMEGLLGEQRTAAWIGTLRAQIEAIISIDNNRISRNKLGRTAHTLVSQAGSLGFIRLSRLSSELEEACVLRTDYTRALSHVKVACQRALSRIDKIQNTSAKHLVGADQT